ncbi:MAG: hypothetical protein A2Z28_07020 [Chloroflexi bacterium RBG_16_51_9]|nr:MAG: hypothetical protein A2Z28_07020 [Chloroflexi bacterium RBG_16_51_9]
MKEDNRDLEVLDPGRRRFLIGAGLVAAGIVLPLGAGLVGCARSETPAAPSEPPATAPPPTPALDTATVPWQYAKLDSVAAAERGYTAYYAGGCMFGSFEGILGELREKVGPPFTAFPTAMMKYGKGGVVSWGTLCGALNGASAAIYLVSDPATGDKLIDELFAWYGAEGLPTYRPSNPKFEISPSVAQSPLCHVSVTTWCETSGFKALSPERSERCAWLTASVVKHTTELLNTMTDGNIAVMPALSSDVSGCLACHGKGGIKENVHASKASSCAICHEPHSLPMQ